MRIAATSLIIGLLALSALSSCGDIGAASTVRGDDFEVGGKTARQVFPDDGVARLAMAACRGDGDEVSRLVHQNVNPNGVGLEGVTALLWASHCENLSGMSALLDAGADPNLRISGLGMSVVVVAAGMQNGRVLELLLSRGGDANAAVDDSNFTTLTVALDAGLDGKGWNNYYALVRAGADINRRYQGLTIAEYAAAMNQYDKVVELLNAGYHDNLDWLGRLVTVANISGMDGDQRRALAEAQTLLEQRGIHFPVPAPARAPL